MIIIKLLTGESPQTTIFLHLDKVESSIEPARKLLAKNCQFVKVLKLNKNLRVVHIEGELLVLQLEHVVVGAGGVHQVIARS